MAVRMRVRSAMNCCSRFCMVLKARAARCTSAGPVSASGARSMLSPRSCAAVASTRSGPVTQRTATRDSTTTVTSSTSSVSPTRTGIAASCGVTTDSKVASVPSRSATCTVNEALPGGNPGPKARRPMW